MCKYNTVQPLYINLFGRRDFGWISKIRIKLGNLTSDNQECSVTGVKIIEVILYGIYSQKIVGKLSHWSETGAGDVTCKTM